MLRPLNAIVCLILLWSTLPIGNVQAASVSPDRSGTPLLVARPTKAIDSLGVSTIGSYFARVSSRGWSGSEAGQTGSGSMARSLAKDAEETSGRTRSGEGTGSEPESGLVGVGREVNGAGYLPRVMYALGIGDGANIIKNGDFAEGEDYWTFSGGAVLTDTKYYTGTADTYSALVDCSTSQEITQTFVIDAGGVYTLEVLTSKHNEHPWNPLPDVKVLDAGGNTIVDKSPAFDGLYWVQNDWLIGLETGTYTLVIRGSPDGPCVQPVHFDHISLRFARTAPDTP